MRVSPGQSLLVWKDFKIMAFDYVLNKCRWVFLVWLKKYFVTWSTEDYFDLDVLTEEYMLNEFVFRLVVTGKLLKMA